jgi:hypothetical protein
LWRGTLTVRDGFSGGFEVHGAAAVMTNDRWVMISGWLSFKVYG